MNMPLRLAVTLAALLVATGLHAASADAAERERIARERSSVQQRYDAAERECQRRFAVTDCLEGAQRERREAMLRLRREETLLDEVQRKQRAADRIEAIRRKVGAEAQARPPAAREPRVAAPPRAPAAAREAAAVADDAASASPLRRGRVTVRQRPAPSSTAADRAAQEARSRAAFEARQDAARERLEENRRRNDERNQGKPPAAPLPTASGAAR